MNKKILLIDGNYFVHRQIGILNMGDNVNNLVSEREITEFKSSLYNGLFSILSTFSDYCDTAIFTRDLNSWRKKEKFVPFFVNEKETLVGYKEQRIQVKQDSEIDYKKLYEIFDEFIINITDKIPTISIDGLEGDDILNLITKINKEDEFVILCTDGDLKQLVSDNCILFRNIKSKDNPNGEIIVSQKHINLLNNSAPKNLTILDQLKGDKQFNTNLLSEILKLNLSNPKYPVDRKINSGISLANPYKELLTKIYCGDKKDNIFSLFGWKNNTRNYKLSEKMLEKAFGIAFMDFNEKTCKYLLTDKDGLKENESIIRGCYSIVKDKLEIKPTMKILLEHFEHNFKMLSLIENTISPNLVDKFKLIYENLNLSENILSENKLNKILLELTSQQKTSKNVMTDSLPEL